jgi:hypothetical protein
MFCRAIMNAFDCIMVGFIGLDHYRYPGDVMAAAELWHDLRTKNNQIMSTVLSSIKELSFMPDYMESVA